MPRNASKKSKSAKTPAANQPDQESKRRKLNASPTLFSEDEEANAKDDNFGDADVFSNAVGGNQNAQEVKKRTELNLGRQTNSKPLAPEMTRGNRETTPPPGPSSRVHPSATNGVVRVSDSSADNQEQDAAQLAELTEKAKEMRKRVILCIIGIFDDSGRSAQAQSPQLTCQTSKISTADIQKLVGFLGVSIRSTPFIHCNLKSSEPISTPESIGEFNDILYPSLGALLLHKDVTPIHRTVMVTVQRLLNHLLKQETEAFERALFSLLRLIDQVKGASFNLAINVPDSLTNSTPPHAITVNISEIYETGLCNVLRMLYPFWTLNKFGGVNLPVRFLEAMQKAWHSSNHFVRCDVLEGFPYRAMIRNEKGQICLCEIVEEVLKYCLKYGLNPKALHFLNQVWEHEVMGHTEGVTFLQVRMSEILLDTMLEELFRTTNQNHVKEFIVGLFDEQRRMNPYFEDEALKRIQFVGIEEIFKRNPLMLYLLDNTIYLECVAGNTKKSGQELELHARGGRRGNSNPSCGSDSIEVISISKLSETWQVLLDQWMNSCTPEDISAVEANSQKADQFCLNLSAQTYVMAKLADSVIRRLLQTAHPAASYSIWTFDFFKRWQEILGKSLQITSENIMDEIMCISIETMKMVSSSSLHQFQEEHMKDIKQTFAFHFSSRWCSFQELSDIKLDIFSEYKSWRRVSLNKADVLQKCVIVLALEFFSECEDMVLKLITLAMKRYTSCLGIVMGLLILVGEFSKLSRKLDVNAIYGFLITCAKRFNIDWKNNEKVETLLAKAFTRLICFTTNHGNELMSSGNCQCENSCEKQNQPIVSPLNGVDADLMKLIEPFFNSTSLKVKLELTELLARFRKHGCLMKKEVLSYFLPFLSDESQVLREKVAANICVYLGLKDYGKDVTTRQELIDCVMMKLRSHLMSVNLEDYSKENVAVMGVLQQFSQVTDHYLQSWIIKLIVELTIKAKSHRLPALYARVMQSTAIQSGIESSQLMGRHREIISKEIVEQLLRIIFPAKARALKTTATWNCVPAPEPIEISLVKMCSSAFNRLIFVGDYVGRSLFLDHFAPLIILQTLPGIRTNRNKQLLLVGFAEFAGVSDSELLIDYFPRYYPLIVLRGSAETTESMIQFVKGIEVEAIFITRCCYQTFSNELLSMMSGNEETVFRTFSLVLQWSNRDDKRSYSKDVVLNYIATRLLGFYVFVQNKLSDSYSSLERKKQILESFIVLLSHLKSEHLQATKFKLYMVLSSLYFTEVELMDCLVRAWCLFASRMEVTELPDMIVQILAAIKLQDNSLEGKLLSSLFEFNRKAFLLAAPGLYFMKDPLRIHIKGTDCSSYFPNGKPLLDLLVKQIGHYNRHIRVYALTKLRDVLKQHNTNEGFDIQEILSERNEMIPDVWNLIMELTRNFCGKADKMNGLATECVGLIGALDPYRVPAQQSQTRAANARPILNTFSPAFLAEYLEKLSQLVQGAFKGSDFDIYAFTIQEVLRGAMIKAEPQNNTWSLLSHKAKAVIEPMFASKYSLRRESEVTHSFPIFGSSKGCKFHEWVYHFIFKMVSLMQPSGQSFSAHTLFDLSKLITTKCPDFACFILPHVVLHAVLACDEEDLASITQELNLVTSQWVPGVFLDGSRDLSRMDSVCLDSLLNNSVVETKKCLDATENLRYANAIFNIIDHISEVTASMSDPSSKDRLDISNEGLEKLKGVIIPKIALSRAAFATGSYHRALKYYEQAIVENNEPLQTSLSYLQRIFVALSDVDSIAGILAIKTTNLSQYENIIANLSFGRKEEAASDFERLFNDEPEHPIARQGLVQVYLALDQPHLAHDILETYFRSGYSEGDFANATGSDSQNAKQDGLLHECRLEACWRLEQWDELEGILNKTANKMPNSWGSTIAEALLNLKNHDFPNLNKTIDVARERFVAPLAGMVNDWDSYLGKYGDIVRLHILSEVQQAGEFLQQTGPSCDVLMSSPDVNEKLEFLLTNWRRKLALIQNAISFIDPIFSVRKILLKIIRGKLTLQSQITNTIDLEIMSYLLKIAKLESKDQNYVRAHNCIVQASKISPMVFIHEAKLLMKKGDDAQGLEIINKGLENNKLLITNPRNRADPFRLQEKLYSKALLMHAQLNDKLRNVDVKENITNYNRACEMYPTEKNFVNMASYFDRVLDDFQDRVKKPLDTQICVLHFYVQSLKHGCKHVFQSLPRLLSIWFDHASNIPPRKVSAASPPAPEETKKSGRKPVKSPQEPDSRQYVDHMNGLTAMTNDIEDLVRNVPTYILLTAFPQLVSRLCHPEEVWPVLKKVLVKLVITYPVKALWMLTSVQKSSFPKRSDKCMEIIREVCKSNPNLSNLTADYAAFAEQLILLSYKGTPLNSTRMSMKSFLPSMEILLRKPNFSNILIPLEHFMTVTLPLDNSNMRTHVPYPEQEVYVTGVEDRVDIMASLQKPKRIVFRGSNGKLYGMMCKANDDLRKDSKVMEFNNVVNWYLSRTSESSQRNLRIRTYAVTPLNEKCGLVEWVENLTSYRSILSSCFKEVGVSDDVRKLREEGRRLGPEHPFEVKLKWYEDSCKRCPAVFANWFLRKYKNPQDWYKARLNYVRTAAVMSVVGYIMGLGDRHGENILIDTRTGDVVHVDFNCLFNLGEGFHWPERVPFRLTKNIIDGFGPLGCEGTFRKICEATLRILRENMEVFLSTMQPFVFDPLVEWSKTPNAENGKQSSSKMKTVAPRVVESQPRNNDEALRHLNEIRLRLLGAKRNMTKQLNVEFSVEAQVNYLIQEASSSTNLCQMYPGWAAYL